MQKSDYYWIEIDTRNNKIVYEVFVSEKYLKPYNFV